jgi:dienelactone hydrolase
MTMDFNHGSPLRWLLLFVAGLMLSCGGGGGNGAPPTDASTVVLARGIYTSGADSWPYELLQLRNSDGGYAYAQWFPASSATPAPVIVRTEPYAGIDWTGLTLDQRWALQGAGRFPDVDGPNFQSGVSGTIGYALFTPNQIGVESEFYLRNGFGVLNTFGRFYAGGSVWNDVQDMVAGLRFLGTQSNVDATRIGMIGTSWGGFEVVYGSAYADAGVVPKASVAIAPVIDFQALANFVDTTLPTLTDATHYPQYSAFFDPYMRRLFASTGSWPGMAGSDYSRVTATAVGARLNTQLLVMHDDGDTILPAATSKAFVAAYPAQAQGFWYTQSSSPPDYNANVLTHGTFGSTTVYAPIYTFSISYLFTSLGSVSQPLLVPYSDADLNVFFQDIRAYQIAARDVSWVVPRLLEFCDARVSAYELVSGNTKSGAQLLADKINTYWTPAVAYDATTVCGQLSGSGLPP